MINAVMQSYCVLCSVLLANKTKLRPSKIGNKNDSRYSNDLKETIFAKRPTSLEVPLVIALSGTMANGWSPNKARPGGRTKYAGKNSSNPPWRNACGLDDLPKQVGKYGSHWLSSWLFISWAFWDISAWRIYVWLSLCLIRWFFPWLLQ